MKNLLNGINAMCVFSFVFAMLAYWFPSIQGPMVAISLVPWALWLVGAIKPTYNIK